MYFVSGSGNLRYKICDLLKESLGDKAEVYVDGYGKLYCKVKADAGFKDDEKYLTKEQVKQGVIGGGVVQGLDGKTFLIEITEVK